MLTGRYLQRVSTQLTSTIRPFNVVFSNRVAGYSWSKPSDLEKLSQDRNKLEDFIPDIQKPHAPDGGIYSVEQTLRRQEAGEELKARMEDLRKRHELLRAQLRKKIEIPFSLCGVGRKSFHESFSYMPERVMSYYRIHSSVITDYLLKIYKASLYSIVDRNTDFMDEYWEAGFKEKVLKSLEQANQKGYKVKLSEQKKFIEQMGENCKIVDAVMLRGLSMNRSENEAPSEYHKYAEDKEFGLITYTPNYLTHDNEKFINPQTNKNVYQGYEKMVLRVLVLIKTPLRLTIPELQVPSQLNTYEHIVIMENQMIAPPHLESRYKLETLVEWLGKYRFGPWNVVDIDNFMRGNSPFRLHLPPGQQMDEIFLNTVMDKAYYCNIRNI